MLGHSKAMERPQFITPALSILLDAVRAGAALLVLGGHAVQTGLYTGPYPFGPTVQHHAVLVFFVLSGLVIAHSVEGGRYNLREYAIARAARIMPVALFAVAFGSILFFVLTSNGFQPQASGEVPDRLTAASIVMPLLFLSESGDGVGPVWNPPYWSLSYEVWFYIIFGAAFFLRGTRRMLWVVALSMIAGWRILLMFPIWLTGAALVRHGTRWEPKGTAALAVALCGVILLSLSRSYALIAQDMAFNFHASFGYLARMSEYFLTDIVYGFGIALIFIAARPFAERISGSLERAKRPIQWLAGCSFSLYILHWPLLMTLSALGIEAGSNPLAFLAFVGGIVGTCAFIAQFTEYRSRDVRAWMTRVTARRPAADRVSA